MDLITPNWSEVKNVHAVSSTRDGGVSLGEYRGLNIGDHVGDDWIKVEHNRQRLMQQAGMPSAPVWLNQTHSTKVVALNAPTSKVIDADGVFTTTPGVVCSAMTADCLPVLLADRQGRGVAAVHAGWRGLAHGIVENALNYFEGEVVAWLGPAIGPAVFEVGDDVRDAFMSEDANAHLAFRRGRQTGKWWADMPRLATQRLNLAGVDAVYNSGLCTYQDSNRFYSYRRDGVTGRQASFIWIEE
ncbi:peptidoglycan editing factor PgeF [Vibrio olivae]|uniref:Purine nucleoside phosphorylase n=1 Tax=Vibrio olivae TaxID=1243002 RepID=A0ABV5HNM7_9VIBR